MDNKVIKLQITAGAITMKTTVVFNRKNSKNRYQPGDKSLNRLESFLHHTKSPDYIHLWDDAVTMIWNY